MFALGLTAALGASALFMLGVALQTLDAREAPPEQGLRLGLIARLLRHPRWVLGTIVGAAGFPLQVAAFAWAPFVVVQPALAAGLLLLLLLGVTMLGERVTRSAIVGVVAITAGIGLIAWGAPGHVEAHRAPAQVGIVVGTMLALSLLPFALRGSRADTGLMVTVASAVGFGTSNVATKLVSDNVNVHHWGNVVAWLAVAAAAGLGAVVTEMTALQRVAATAVVPISFAIQTFLPIVLEPLFLRERIEADGLAQLLTGMLVMLLGIVAVARTRAVSLLAGGSGG